ncbi:tRNA modification GTPase MnmE [Novipirellula aureliae]|uniref:tRNA modification GTPase MnmE n=1 Tax=Novipirellula aureliae TaxID=2527966 RepID=A0A5C6E4G5_9BACT|nr:tRNA modification GTPase [Novipirellula aureliae]TWU43720.1 tRNA modification GTPase MnmE [Novipirellula aureliae]
MLDSNETIVAIASPSTPSARGIVRLSGESVLSVLQSLSIDLPSEHGARAINTRLDLEDPLGIINVTLLLWPSRRSYTGQPSAEIHTYGSLPILQSIVQRLTASGARAARPGEFTMRAFLAGRLDLTQAEAVLGVIEAEGRGSLNQALEQLAGNLSRPLEQMRSMILDLLADVEAGLDFVDEDIEFISDDMLVKRLTDVRDSLKNIHSKLCNRGGASAMPIIVLRGEPNAGKSQLVNAIAGNDAAIVANVAGTTRDAVYVTTTIGGTTRDGTTRGGRKVQFVDTAGIEQETEDKTLDEIASASQGHADRAGLSADIRLWCVDLSAGDLSENQEKLRPFTLTGKRSVIDIWVATKTDLVSKHSPINGWVYTSAISGAGVAELKEQIESHLDARDQEETGSVIGTAARCSQSLNQAEQAISSAIELVANGDGHELVASDLRLAAECLGEVTGAVYTDDLLDRVFSRFCIGK